MIAKRKWEIGAGATLVVALVGCAGWFWYHSMLDRSLVTAMEKRDRAAVRDFLRRGANVNVVGSNQLTPLLFVLNEDRDPALVRMLLDRGAKTNVQDNGGGTTLMAVVGTPVSSPEILQEFVNGGADVHAKTRWGGYTALIHASLRGDTEAVKFLLAHGADPNVRNDRGWTALTQLQGFPEIIRLLKKAGGKR